MMLPKRDASSLEAAASALRGGKLVVLPTDTIYGFSAIDTEEGASLIHGAKKRGREKSLIRLIASPDWLGRYSPFPLGSSLLSLWPGPLTLVAPLFAGGTAAFRCPGDAWLRSVIAKAGRAIFSSSANASGEAPLARAADIEARFGDVLDLIIEDDRPEGGGGLPSTIVDVSARPYRVLRQGAAAIPDGLLNS